MEFMKLEEREGIENSTKLATLSYSCYLRYFPLVVIYAISASLVTLVLLLCLYAN